MCPEMTGPAFYLAVGAQGSREILEHSELANFVLFKSASSLPLFANPSTGTPRLVNHTPIDVYL